MGSLLRTDDYVAYRYCPRKAFLLLSGHPPGQLHEYVQVIAAAAAKNAAKYLAGEACFRACENAILTHGGMGYAKEYHVERLLREVTLTRIAPVTEQLILSFIGENVLDLPKSY